MCIKESLSHDKGRDIVEGFTPGCQTLANHALVFMVRGLTGNWKQPLGYHLSSGPMSGSNLKQLLLECIDKVEETGLKVMVVISDQGSNNQNMFKSLGSSALKPYFLHENSKIYLMYDPPHLLKNIRNNLKKHGFTVGSDDKDVSWDCIQHFYQLDSEMPIRFAPKLTKKHIDLPPFAPLRVNLAAQVLSHSVSTGLHMMIQFEKLPG